MRWFISTYSNIFVVISAKNYTLLVVQTPPAE